MSPQPGASPQPGGRRRMVRWTLALYPRAWRARYGSEVASLSEELIAEGDSTPWRAGLDLITGAAVERGRALARSRRIAVVPAVAVLLAAAGTGWAVDKPHPARPSTQAASLASVGCLPGPARAVRVHGPGPARSWSFVVVPPPGWKLSRVHGPAGQVPLKASQVPLKAGQVPLKASQVPLKASQVPLKASQVPLKGIWCITRLPGPCSVSLSGPPTGVRARPGRPRWISLGPPGRLRPVRLGTVPAQVRPAQVRWRSVPGGVMVSPGRCILLPPRCVKKIALPRGAIRVGRLPGPGWAPGLPLGKPATLRPATLRPATLRPVPGPARIPAAVCAVAAGVA